MKKSILLILFLLLTISIFAGVTIFDDSGRTQYFTDGYAVENSYSLTYDEENAETDLRYTMTFTNPGTYNISVWLTTYSYMSTGSDYDYSNATKTIVVGQGETKSCSFWLRNDVYSTRNAQYLVSYDVSVNNVAVDNNLKYTVITSGK